MEEFEEYRYLRKPSEILLEYCIILNYLNLGHVIAANKGHRDYNFSFSSDIFPCPVPVEGGGAILYYKIPWLGNYNLLS